MTLTNRGDYRARYEVYLQTDHWRSLRTRAFQIYGDRCILCRAPHPDGHHLIYRDLVSVEPREIVPLCRDCHERVHVAEDCNGLGRDFPSLQPWEKLGRILKRFRPRDQWMVRLARPPAASPTAPRLTKAERRTRQRTLRRRARRQARLQRRAN